MRHPRSSPPSETNPSTPRSCGALWERTEGWAAGLQLAALTVFGTDQPAEAATAIHGNDRHIMDYLSSEVVDRLLPEHRELLLGTSMLERLCGPLCDYVLDREGSDAVLAELDRATCSSYLWTGIGVVQVSPALSARSCCRRLQGEDSAEPARVHAKAAEWFLQVGLLDEAVGHLINAGDETAAAGAAPLEGAVIPRQGALAEHLRLGQRLDATMVMADPQTVRVPGVGCRR